MSISRRDLFVAGAGLVAAGGCARIANSARRQSRDLGYRSPSGTESERLLNRLSFGWSSQEERTFQELGKEQYLESQLRASFPEPLELTLQVQSLDAIRLQAVELMEIPRARVVEQLQSAAILRATYSPNQLKERMVDFWSNHFNIYSGKADGAFFKGNEEEQIVRKFALGKFPEMLKSITKSPSMLVYLDNQLNFKGHPNENFARELLELHSLGIDGGYTQKDIQEVARCLTGWAMETRFLRPKGSFRFDEEKHDLGAKVVLGVKIPSGGGLSDGEAVLDLLANHPSTAKHLARKLVTHFTGGRHEELEKKVATQYANTGGDISAMMRVIVQAPELTNGPTKLRRPFDFLVACLRRSNAETDGGPALQTELRKMGQLLYDWPLPDGYPVDQVSWATNMLPRWQFAYNLAHGKIKETSVPNEYLKVEGRQLLARRLASPEFQVV